ncbi:hypothetical protein [Gordonia sp. (in: high G+C Gram-positive bacteria)]|uniref:hypothetical protein n=1 Tax=Gordonia sp. (in: high G+C Gram-positive bacteria) TaxID=84139 RepID=UPI003340E01A
MTLIALYDRRYQNKYATVETNAVTHGHDGDARTIAFNIYDLDLVSNAFQLALRTSVQIGADTYTVNRVEQIADERGKYLSVSAQHYGDMLAYFAHHTTQENPMTTIDPATWKPLDGLYEQAINTYRVEYGETIAVSHNERAVRAVVDYVLAAPPEQIDRKPYILRAAVAIVRRETGHNLYAVAELANRLEAERKAAQERAEQDRQIEVLAENTFEHITDTGFGTLSDSQQEKWREAMRRARTHILAEAVTE